MIGVANHVSDWSGPNFRRIQFVVLDPTVVRNDQAFRPWLVVGVAPPLPFYSSLWQANKAIIVALTKRPAYAHKNLQPTLPSLGKFLGESLNFRKFDMNTGGDGTHSLLFHPSLKPTHRVIPSVVYHPNTGRLAGIGMVPALAGWFIQMVFFVL